MLQQAYHDVFKSSEQRAVLETTPVDYIWSDGDTVEAGSEYAKSAIKHANASYRAIVPHYELIGEQEAQASHASKNESGPIYTTEQQTDDGRNRLGNWHSYMAGTTKFIATDTRTYLLT